MTKASRNRKTIRGIFHHMSLVNPVPQFQHAASPVIDIRPHLRQGRRGAEVSRPHAPQYRPGAGAEQYGQGRADCPAASIPRESITAAVRRRLSVP